MAEPLRIQSLQGARRPYHFMAVVLASAAVFLPQRTQNQPDPSAPSPSTAKNATPFSGARGSSEAHPGEVPPSAPRSAPQLAVTKAEKGTGKLAFPQKPLTPSATKKKSLSVKEVIVTDQNLEVLNGVPVEDPAVAYAPPEQVEPGATLEEFLKSEMKVLDILRKAHRSLRQSIAELWAARGVRRRATASIKASLTRTTTQKQKLERKTQRLSTRYRALYKLADGGSLIPLFNEKNRSVPTDGRVEMARALSRELEELQAEKKLTDALIQKHREREKLLNTAKERVALLDKRRDGCQAVIALLHQHLRELRRRKEKRDRSREVWNKKLRRLNRSVRDLAALVKEESRSFLSLKGALPRPVPGMILRRFGEERVKGTRVTVRRRGIEISALKGWKARSPARGVVRYAGTVAGFHHVVILDHGEGFLSVLGLLRNLRVREGQTVKGGSVVGDVFYDPNCRKWDCTRVYFELRRGSVALNPSRWFRSGRKKKRSPGRDQPDPEGAPSESSATNLAGR